MRYTVNDNCIGCGMCAATCPQVFSIGEDGCSRAVREELPAELEAAAEDTMKSCPTGAIELLE